MASFNRIIIMGNLTRDPEHKQLPSGQAVCRLGIASNRQFSNKQTGDTVQEVCYIDIDVWGPQAASCQQYLSKGRPVMIEGRLKFDQWQDKENGATRSKHSIVADRVIFLSSQNSAENEGGDFADVEDDRKSKESVQDQLRQQFDQLKKSAGAVTPAKSARVPQSAGNQPALPEIQLKDVPPFQDDLPF